MGGSGGGKRRAIPWSVLMSETNRKKANNRNEMSDIELVFKPGSFLPIVFYLFLLDFMKMEAAIAKTAPITMVYTA